MISPPITTMSRHEMAFEVGGTKRNRKAFLPQTYDLNWTCPTITPIR